MENSLKLIKVGTEAVINNFVNVDTGELLDSTIDVKNHKIVVSDRETFAIQYSTIIGAFKKLNGNDVKLLGYCAFSSTLNTNMVFLTKPVCEAITKAIGIPYQSIRNSAANLCKHKILIPLGNATYRINPRYYWRGDSLNRKKTMKYILELECPNC